MAKISLHGMSKSPEYGSWSHMKSRCNNKNNPRYEDYGGRGISVCDDWNKDFISFFSFMGNKPSPSHSIDRVDNDGNYCPENCRWATEREQADNKRPKSFMDRPMVNNKSTGAVGVWHDKSRGRYMVRLNGKYLGQSFNLAEAVEMRKMAELELN